MKQIVRFMYIIFVLLFFGGCNNQDIIETTTEPIDTITELSQYTVTLIHNDETYLEMTVESNQPVIDLDFLEQDQMIFVGWSDGLNIYYPSYEVSSDVTLNAIFENPSDVFEVVSDYHEYHHAGVITSYTGNAKYLKVPQYINEYLIIDIEMKAFENSSIIEIELPADVTISTAAFLNSKALKKVSFYGEYLDYYHQYISNEEYDEIMNTYGELCIIESYTDEGWIFAEGSPIHEVLRIGQAMIIGGKEYFSYEVLFDYNVFQPYYHLTYEFNSFLGASSLESIEIPGIDTSFTPSAFDGCENLRDLSFTSESENFIVIDGVLYTKDGTELVYYPSGRVGSSFTVPDEVNHIGMQAFNDNHSIKSLTLSEYVEDIGYLIGFHQLEEIIVNENHPNLESIDGILYQYDVLLKYPAAKLGTSYSIPNDVTKIGPFAFENNQYLESIDFGSQITMIGDQAFWGTKSISVIELPASLGIIYSYIMLESSIDTIILNRDAVSDGIVLLLTMLDPKRLYEGIYIYVPDDALQLYQNNYWWNLHGEFIKPLSEYTS